MQTDNFVEEEQGDFDLPNNLTMDDLYRVGQPATQDWVAERIVSMHIICLADGSALANVRGHYIPVRKGDVIARDGGSLTIFNVETFH